MKIQAKNYYALLCCSSKSPLICGVYASRAEAKKANEEIKDCAAKHIIKKCNIEIEI